MNKKESAGPWVRRFLLEHVVAERNLARNTQKSYRDALALFLPFAAKDAGKAIDKLTLEDFSTDVIRKFLASLEDDRGSSVSTRNQRLASIHAWARFVSERLPEQVSWAAQVRAIPFKKAPRTVVAYLEKEEMDALLECPDRNTIQGRRDYAILLILYNSGARASELANAKIADLSLASTPSIRILGKGNKTRLCPLWQKTIDAILPLTSGRENSQAIFLNRSGQAFTRFGILGVVKRYAGRVASKFPSIKTKKVGTHTIRHTTAVHLLRSGVDINTIRGWLGHVSLNTTNIYAEIDLKMKAEALANCIPDTPEESKQWRAKSGVIAFLKEL